MTSVSFRNKTIIYSSKGEGFPLVFLHGYLESKEVWEDFSKKFPGFQVIMPDLPGHGESSVYGDTHTMDFMAKSVKNILDVEGIEKCIIFGHSMGGYVAEAFARLFPENLEGLGLIHSSIYADNEEKKQNRLREIEIIKQGKLNIVVANMLPNLIAEQNKPVVEKTLNLLVERAKGFDPNGVIAVLNGMRLRPEHKIDAALPTLLVGSDSDNFISVEAYNKMAQENPSIQFEMILGCGHASFLEKPGECSEIVQSFASQRDKSRPII